MGEGVLGEKGCAVILSEPRFENLPSVLETGRDHGAPALEDVELAKKLRTRGKSNRRQSEAMSEREADALVIFGITGDLARKQTFRSLYRLERRGLLDLPVLGVARQGHQRRGASRSRARDVDRADR